MLPFDRFVRTVDEWAGSNPQHDVFIQIGSGEYEPRHARWERIVSHQDYRRKLDECQLFVAHVGMGSILQALEARKQILMMPRLRELGEHTTDHQLHTAARFSGTTGLRIVDDPESLKASISELVERPLETSVSLAPHATPALLDGITNFLRPVGAN